jgi:hypothetical protein
MNRKISLCAVVAAGALALAGCSGDGDASPSEAASASSDSNVPAQKAVGQPGGAYCGESDSDNPEDWNCAVLFTVTALKIGDTCSALGYPNQEYGEPEKPVLRIDADMAFAPEADDQETIFGAATNWEVETGDGFTTPLQQASACYGDGGYDGNNSWSTSSQPGRKYQRTTLFELPAGAEKLVLTSIQSSGMQWEWELPDTGAGDDVAVSGGPHPTVSAA